MQPEYRMPGEPDPIKGRHCRVSRLTWGPNLLTAGLLRMPATDAPSPVFANRQKKSACRSEPYPAVRGA
jgi:hypothetical protein